MVIIGFLNIMIPNLYIIMFMKYQLYLDHYQPIKLIFPKVVSHIFSSSSDPLGMVDSQARNVHIQLYVCKRGKPVKHRCTSNQTWQV